MANGKGPGASNSYGKITQREDLMKIRPNDPYFKRNEAHICSFFVKGVCNRGTSCPFRHELPKHDPSLAKQNIKDRYYGTNDPVAKKLLNKVGVASLTPPADPTVKTLFIGSVTEDITEDDLRHQFYLHGEMETIKLNPSSGCAFVTFATREGAERAAEAMHNNLFVSKNGIKIELRLNWAKPMDKSKQQQNQNNNNNDNNNSTSTTNTANLSFIGLSSTNPSQYPSMSATRIGAKTDR